MLKSGLISLALVGGFVLALPVSNVCRDGSAQEIPKGQIVEKLECLADSAQSYALYLPTNYTPERKWPILYAFDPGAQGKRPVERFKDAAEKYGWIVVGSNNSRNGPWQRGFDAWNAMAKDTHQRLSIDDERLYTTGFSGGARMAVQIAPLCQDCLAGVIACGAGFPAGLAPSNQMHFRFIGTAGVDDFNFAELRNLETPLEKAGMTHRLVIFDGRHEWAPPTVAALAIEWLELHAMKDGKRPIDEAFVNAMWDRSVKQAGSLAEAKKYYEAHQIYLDLAESFKNLRDVAEVEQKASQLRESREVKNAIRDEQQQISKQAEIESQLRSLIAAREQISLRETPATGAAGINDVGNTAAEPLDQIGNRLGVLLNQLRKQSKAELDSGTRRVARRVLDGVFISLFEQASGFLQTEQYRKAIRVFTLAVEVNPDRSGAFFYLAWCYAAIGEKNKSLEALRTAVERGFSDSAAISNNKVFDPLRNDARYQQIVARLMKDK